MRRATGPLVWGGWVATALTTILAFAVRIIGLANPSRIYFDETYYAKDAWSLLTLGYNGKWAEGSDAAFSLGDTSGLSDAASFTVHPPLGQWLIAVGYVITGTGPTPFGWRISAVIAGTLGVLFVCRVAWLLSKSSVATVLAGSFLAFDGIHAAMSRIAMLDIFLSTFVLLAVWALLRDDQRRTASAWRPFLLVAGVALGSALAIKWSAIWAIAVFGLFVAYRDWQRIIAGNGQGTGHGPLAKRVSFRWLLDFTYLMFTSLVIYLLSWTSWFLSPNAWGRPGSGRVIGSGNALSDWCAYQHHILDFHQGVTEAHSFASGPATWLMLGKPTLFFSQTLTEGSGPAQLQTIGAVGNPLLWWLGIGALVWMTGAAIIERSAGYALILSAFGALYLPWFLFPTRTMFNFYSVAFVPYIAIALALALTWIIQEGKGSKWRWLTTGTSVAISVIVLLAGIWVLPTAIGIPLPIEQWFQHTLSTSWTSGG